MPINTKGVSSNPVHGEVYSIQHYVIKFVSDLRQVCGFLRYSRFLHQKEEFEDIIGVIRIRKSKKKIQHNGQKEKHKKTNNDLQNIHIKLKIE